MQYFMNINGDYCNIKYSIFTVNCCLLHLLTVLCVFSLARFSPKGLRFPRQCLSLMKEKNDVTSSIFHDCNLFLCCIFSRLKLAMIIINVNRGAI